MRVCLELEQSARVVWKVLVKVGDLVLRGQLVATPVGFGANVHASVAGEVLAVSNLAVVIRMAGDQSADFVKIPSGLSYLEAIEHAGVVGAGGAGFPAHLKYANRIEGGVVIANAVECEPVLGHNVKLIEENPEVIVRGLKYLLAVSGATKAYVAIKAKYQQAVKALVVACQAEAQVAVKFVPDLYPAGDERVIVRELLQVELKPQELPLVAKAIISNVETIKRVVEAIEERKPVIEKDFTVAGRLQSEPTVFLDQPLGLPVSHYLQKCGGYVKPYGEIVIGGPFTGKRASSTAPTAKTTSGIFVAMPFPQEPRKIGLLACECGASEARLREIAEAMGANIVASEACKRMAMQGNRHRCDAPGLCPGQAEKILKMKKAGIEALIAGSCEP